MPATSDSLLSVITWGLSRLTNKIVSQELREDERKQRMTYKLFHP